jgi:REP element-mobilizing transposase RayT
MQGIWGGRRGEGFIDIDPKADMSKSRFDPQKHHRRSIRLKGYDYSQEGAYYVTIVTQGRVCLFGEIIDGEMHLNAYGEIIQKWWYEIPIHFPNVELGAFVIMPNHVHGIIFIIAERRGEVLSPRDDPNRNIQDAYVDGTNKSGGVTPPLRKPTLGQIIAYFKYQSTKMMNLIETDKAITRFWQRNFYEHIIRNEQDLQNKTDYINANPSLWDEDDNNPRNFPPS